MAYGYILGLPIGVFFMLVLFVVTPLLIWVFWLIMGALEKAGMERRARYQQEQLDAVDQHRDAIDSETGTDEK